MASKRYAQINRKICVACGTCLRVCPRGAITVVKGCYGAVDAAVCVGCGLCAKACPADCIELLERGAVQ